jgi:hypothetical protein
MGWIARIDGPLSRRRNAPGVIGRPVRPKVKNNLAGFTLAILGRFQRVARNKCKKHMFDFEIPRLRAGAGPAMPNQPVVGLSDSALPPTVY